jgi:hypothetical protein
MTNTVDQDSPDPAVKPMVFSHASAEKTVASPHASGPAGDDDTRRDLFSAGIKHPRP